LDKLPKKYLFIDESGDAAFYAKGKKLLVGKDGFQPLLLLGLITVDDKKKLHDLITGFQNEISSDPLYKTLKCVADPNGWYLHARNDQLEIRSKFTESLRKFDGFKSYTVIGRKRLSTFENKHNSNESEFYFDMVYHLLKDRLNDEKCFYQILLSGRTGSSTEKLKTAIERAIERDNKKRKVKLNIKFDCRTVPANITPELSIVDYLLWALQRYIMTSDERYYHALKDKYNLIIDLYDIEHFGTNYYNSKNRFDKTKASEFKTDGYIK
jgi:hypothetical protein